MKPDERVAKLEAAYRLLREETTTFQKFEEIRTLIKGINPQIDKLLVSCSRVIKKIKKVQNREIIELSLEVLPEKTKEQKKRKKALLLFLSSWRQLCSEVERVKKIYEESQKTTTKQEKISSFEKIYAFAKGPFGIITLAAIVIVAVLTYLGNIAVTVVVKNQGCAPITPIVRIPISIPGLQLPQEAIPDGGQTVAKLPPLTFTVDGTQRSTVTLTAFKLTMDFKLEGRGIDLLFNGNSLLDQRTTIYLSSQPRHELVVHCK